MSPNFEEAVKQERREYFRNWRASNKDKVRQHNQNYWRRRAERKLQEQKERAD